MRSVFALGEKTFRLAINCTYDAGLIYSRISINVQITFFCARMVIIKILKRSIHNLDITHTALYQCGISLSNIVREFFLDTFSQERKQRLRQLEEAAGLLLDGRLAN